MSGFIIRLSKETELTHDDLKSQANTLCYPFRHNTIHSVYKPNFSIVSVNNPCQNCSIENEEWFVFLYGSLYRADQDSSKNDISFIFDNLLKSGINGGFEYIFGSFICFLFNKNSNTAYIVNDKIGSIQVYTTKIENERLFATEWKAFLGYKGFTPKINQPSILNSLLFGRVKFTNAPFCQDCLAMNPGTMLVVSPDLSISQRILFKYRNMTDSPSNQPITFDDAVDQYKQSVNALVSQFDKPALFLSGGMDSRLIAAAISPENKAKVIGVSFGMRGNNKSLIASDVAKCLNLRYIDFELSSQLFIDYANACVNITEGQDIFAQGYLLYVCDQLRRDHDVEIILDGMEVGVSLGGDYLKETFNQIAEEDLNQWLYDHFYIHKDHAEDVFQFDVNPIAHQVIENSLKNIKDIPSVYEKLDYIYIENYTREVMRSRHRVHP